MGCHGMRGQALPESVCGEFDDDCVTDPILRTGLSALSGNERLSPTDLNPFRGAHHANYDGVKLAVGDARFRDNPLAHSYRFIRALRGYGNEQARWQNASSVSHNEYSAGYRNDTWKDTDYEIATCTRCHDDGQSGVGSRLTTPSQTMTGFCITCHGSFHSSGTTNTTSGAFLRHPSDYVIPNRGEYAAYTTYSVTAPVGRSLTSFVAGMTASAGVNHGQDMVMCLSCHMAHASPYDGMLRFDYSALTSGMRAGTGNQTHAGVGCLACHTAKGGPMP